MTKQFLLILAAVLLLGTGPALAAPLQIDIAQTVVKRQLAEDVDADDAVESMKLRANMLNIKLVAELPLSKQIEAMGQASRRMEIYQFCDPLTAKKMVEYNIDFAAYLPCRIALVEDAAGKYWLVMTNLDMLIRGATLDASLKKEAEKVRDVLNEIMDAGVNGDL